MTPRRNCAGRPLAHRGAVAGLAALVLFLALGTPGLADIAAPGDIYYDVHLDHIFKYGPFAHEAVVWQNSDHTGTEPNFTAARDTVLTAFGSGSIATTVDAAGGSFRASLTANLDLSARTGAFLYETNRMDVAVYIKGPSGTPYRVVVSRTGDLLASRTGGAPGTLQPLNGISWTTFADSIATVDYTGTDDRHVFDSRVYAGHTTTAILVGTDTYSLAGSYSYTALARVTQNYCILGCMTAPADFSAHCHGAVALDVYVCDDSGGGGFPCSEVPSPAPELPVLAAGLELSVQPNPFNPRTELRFAAPPGQPAVLEIYDARGALVQRLFDATALDGPQHVVWDAGDAASGLYVARLRSGSASTQQKIMLLR